MEVTPPGAGPAVETVHTDHPIRSLSFSSPN
jgi:hypothetical protein